MFKFRHLSIATAAILSLSANVSALEFHTVGYKSVGMGGAAIANSSGSTAAYNNPAMLAFAKHDVEVFAGVGMSIHDGGMVASMSELDDLGFSDTIDRIDSGDLSNVSPADHQTLVDAGDIILNMNGQSAQVAPQAALGIQVGSFGTGLFVVGEGGAVGVIEEGRTEFIFEHDGSYFDAVNLTPSDEDAYNNTSIVKSIEDGETYSLLYGIAIAEIPIAYGHAFDTEFGKVAVGGAVKFMQGTTFAGKFALDNDEDFSDTMDNNDKKTSQVGLDLGLAYKPNFSKDLTLALAGKNLNSPEFDYVTNNLGLSAYEVEPMIRFGAAYDIFDSLEIAMDYDLTANETMMPNIDAQYLGGGVNFHPFTWLSLRGGAMKNMDSSDDAGLIYTAGVGLGTKWIQLDISGQMSKNEVNVNGEDYPEYAKVNIALVSKW
ncbi:MAG: conjugal transfer protein TraF [Campylobacterota bacterium]|nr:conjugal transfer protein TraF [Campylobacterota bacterium]